MNIFDIFFKEEYKNLEIIKNNNRLFTIEDIRPSVFYLIDKLNESKKKYAAIVSENNFDFYINFLASVFARKEIFLTTDLHKLPAEKNEYIILDEIPEKTEDNKTFDIKFNPQNIFLNLFTSGTGGSPKRIIKSLQNLITETEDCRRLFEEHFRKPSTVISSAVPHHMYGIVYYMMLSMCNCDSVIFDAQEISYPDTADLEDKIFVSTPSFLDEFRKHDIKIQKTPRLVFSAGDKLKEETARFFANQNIDIIEIYGSTETGTIAHKQASETEYTCFQNVEIAQDNAFQAVVKSPYFQEPSVVIADIIEKINDKKFVLKNRNDRVVKIQEKRISLPEIEEYIKSCEFVNDAYCFKLKDKLACAAVLTAKGQEFCIKDPAGITKFLKNNLKNKTEIIPQKWRFLYEIPKTKTGKTNKQEIEKLFLKNISIPLVLDKKVSENEITYNLVFLKNSNFFKGHFDSLPILPGVVQLYFAHYFAQCAFGEKISESPVKKIKFSHTIKPSEKLSLLLKKTDTSVSYSYKKEERLCSCGVFPIEKR